MQGGEPIFGEKKLMGISFMRREGVLRVNLRGFLQGFFKGEKRKKDSVILYTAKSMFRKKITHLIEKNIKL